METSVNNKCMAFTSLEQSKKLAEILPLESADMYYFRQIDSDYFPPDVESICPIPLFKDGKEDFNYDIPCWSLAALLGVLPRFIEYKGDKYYLRFMKEYVEYANDEVSITGRCLHTTGNDNLVDACYQMIMELNELKML